MSYTDETPWTIRQREVSAAARFLRERVKVYDRKTGEEKEDETQDLIDDAAQARVPLLRIIRISHARPEIRIAFGHIPDVRKAFKGF